MKFSESWLRSLCNPALDSDALCHLLTMAGLEVEQIEPVAPPFSGVVVAQILQAEPHPNADKLKVCVVDVGGAAPLQIVCGAPNAAAGMKVPCARVGAKLPDFEIKAAKLRGVESFGMMCSGQELGLPQESNGLLVLPEDAPVGMDLRDYLELDDRSITIKLTPNRADCLSLLGIAREVAALTRSPLAWTPPASVAENTDVAHEVRLEAPEACPRYVGRCFHGIDASRPTPSWLRRRLERCGLRSISILVDITNYVMLEMGQPLHVFDRDKLQGAIRIRYGRAGDCIQLLNGQQVVPTVETLVIADERGPVALAGVMGGADSSVDESTRNIFLESAFFIPSSIAGRARELGFSSDAAHRFERGVDFDLPQIAITRASQLIVDLCGGQAGPLICVESLGHLPVRERVLARPQRVRRVLGVDLSDERMVELLRGLALDVEVDPDGFRVAVPSYRFDLAIEEDLIEEIARLHGYDAIDAAPPLASMRMAALPERWASPNRLRCWLAGRDYFEVVNFAFVDETWERDFAGNEAPIQLANPIASQFGAMRSSLIGGLVGTLAINLRRRVPRVRLFEMGRVFQRGEGEVDGYAQPLKLAVLAWGPTQPEQWGTPARRVDFFDLKADLEQLLEGRARFAAATHPALHPGRSAEVVVDGLIVGHIGELHPRWVQRYDLQSAPVVFEVELDAVLAQRLPAHTELSRFPAVSRDLALVVPQEMPVDELLQAMHMAASAIVQTLEPFDVYQGQGLPAARKSVAFRVVMQHTDRTLEDAEVEATVAALIQAAAGLGAVLRT